MGDLYFSCVCVCVCVCARVFPVNIFEPNHHKIKQQGHKKTPNSKPKPSLSPSEIRSSSLEGLEGARNPPPSGHSDQHLPPCAIVPPRPSSQESCPPRGAQGFTNTTYLLPASPHPSLSHPPQLPLEHSPRGNQSKPRAKTGQATSAFVPACAPVAATTARHRASPLPQPPLCPGVLHGAGVGAQVVHCVWLDSVCIALCC